MGAGKRRRHLEPLGIVDGLSRQAIEVVRTGLPARNSMKSMGSRWSGGRAGGIGLTTSKWLKSLMF